MLLPHVEKVLQDLRKARRAVDELHAATGGTLSIGSALTTSTYTLPEILSDFTAAHPKVEVQVRTGRSNQVEALVLDDAVQLGLVHSPLAPNANIKAVPLYDEPIILVVHPNHPLAREKRVTPEQLATEPFITSDRASGYWSLVEQFWSAAGLVPHVTMELDSIEATKRMVMCGLGLTMLPKATVEQELITGQLISVPVANSTSLTRQTLLIYRRGKFWSGIVRAFVKILEDTYHIDLAIEK